MGKRGKRQLVLMAHEGALGSMPEVLRILARFNTGVDGGPPKALGTTLLHGPGFILEVPASADEVTQAIVHATDEELALPVLMRLCKAQRWKMIDLESGRSFG